MNLYLKHLITSIGIILMLMAPSLLFCDQPPYTVVEDCSTLQIRTPFLKERKSVKIILPNGLKAYIFSDPIATKSAAALAVRAGSWQDDPNHFGMAHFVEHMLFKGNGKYEKENEYQQFVLDCGGNTNAFTAADRTLYGFSINNLNFEAGLDRFCHFFIDPLFNMSDISRELQVIDQEYRQGASSDFKRKYYIIKELGNPDHPNYNFAVGNTNTLGNVLRDTVVRWYKEYYGANQMFLVIYSRMPLKQACDLVAEKFSAIPSPVDNPAILGELSSGRQKGQLIGIEPLKHLKQLDLIWELPQKYANVADKSLDLISFTMNRGHKNSLLEILKQKNLALDLQCSKYMIGKNVVFSLSVRLTENGIAEHAKVLRICLDAIESLKLSGIPRYLFDEMNTLRTIRYEYQPSEDAFDFTFRNAEEIMDETFASYPDHTVLAREYLPQEIFTMLDLLSPEHCQAYLTCPNILKNVKNPSCERYLGGRYAILTALEKILPEKGKTPAATLPPPNPFMPGKLALQEQVANSATLERPEKIIDNSYGFLFYAFDNIYQTPQIAGTFRIKSPILDNGAKNLAMKALYLMAVNKSLQPSLFAADDAGLCARLSFSRSHLTIKADGYSEKYTFLIEEILKGLKNVTLTEEIFSIYKKELIAQYENRLQDLPAEQSINMFEAILKNKPEPKDILLALENLTLEEFLSFCENIFSKTYIEGLLCGNLTVKEAESIWVDIQEIIVKKAASPSLFENRKELPVKGDSALKINLTTTASGSGMVLGISQGPSSYKERVAQLLLSTPLQEAFFNTLRTRQKTGYMVTGWCDEYKGNLMQYFAIQSGTHEAQDLLERTEIFLEDYLEELEKNISEERFVNLKKEKLTLLSMIPENLQKQTELLTFLAFRHHEEFDRRQKLSQVLTELTYKEFLQFCKESLGRKNRARLAILCQGLLPKEHIFSYRNTTTAEMQKEQKTVSSLN